MLHTRTGVVACLTAALPAPASPAAATAAACQVSYTMDPDAAANARITIKNIG